MFCFGNGDYANSSQPNENLRNESQGMSESSTESDDFHSAQGSDYNGNGKDENDIHEVPNDNPENEDEHMDIDNQKGQNENQLSHNLVKEGKGPLKQPKYGTRRVFKNKRTNINFIVDRMPFTNNAL